MFGIECKSVCHVFFLLQAEEKKEKGNEVTHSKQASLNFTASFIDSGNEVGFLFSMNSLLQPHPHPPPSSCLLQEKRKKQSHEVPEPTKRT